MGLHLDQFQRIVADPASVTVIRYTPTRPFLIRLNDTGGDLAGLVPPKRRRRPAKGRDLARTRSSAAGPARPEIRSGRTPLIRSPHSRQCATRAYTWADRVFVMTHQVHAFEPPERFVAGTVGPPGERSFFLQARGGGRVVSVALEKVQVSLLAEKLEELLTEAARRFGVDLELPPRSRRRRRRQRAAGEPGRRGVPGRHARPGVRRRHRHRGDRGDRGRRGRAGGRRGPRPRRSKRTRTTTSPTTTSTGSGSG